MPPRKPTGSRGRSATTQTKRRTESERRRVKRGLPPQRQPGEGRQAGDADEGEDDRFDGVEV